MHVLKATPFTELQFRLAVGSTYTFAFEGSQRKAILTPTSTPKLNAVLKANAVVG